MWLGGFRWGPRTRRTQTEPQPNKKQTAAGCFAPTYADAVKEHQPEGSKGTCERSLRGCRQTARSVTTLLVLRSLMERLGDPKDPPSLSRSFTTLSLVKHSQPGLLAFGAKGPRWTCLQARPAGGVWVHTCPPYPLRVCTLVRVWVHTCPPYPSPFYVLNKAAGKPASMDSCRNPGRRTREE